MKDNPQYDEGDVIKQWKGSSWTMKEMLINN